MLAQLFYVLAELTFHLLFPAAEAALAHSRVDRISYNVTDKFIHNYVDRQFTKTIPIRDIIRLERVAVPHAITYRTTNNPVKLHRRAVSIHYRHSFIDPVVVTPEDPARFIESVMSSPRWRAVKNVRGIEH